jgi:hypothetical protein
MSATPLSQLATDVLKQNSSRFEAGPEFRNTPLALGGSIKPMVNVTKFEHVAGVITPASLLATERQIIQYAAAVDDPDDVIEIRRIFRSDPKVKPRSSWHYAATLGELAPALMRENAAGWEIYFGANPREAMGKRGDESIKVARTAFVDFDDTTLADALARIRAVGLPVPTLVIVSGHGVHCYWRLARPMTDMAAWTVLQLRLIAALNSDSTIQNPERIMRAPGFLNLKREPHVPCEIVSSDATQRHDLATINQILDAHGIPADPTPKPAPRVVTAEQLTAAKARTNSTGADDSVIDQFNDAYDIEAILKTHGYTDAGGDRMNRPGGETAGVHLIDWLSFHFSTNDALNDGKFGHFSYHNPFSAFCILEHRGNVKQAVFQAAKLLGIEKPKAEETQHTERWHARRRAIRTLAQAVSTEAA